MNTTDTEVEPRIEKFPEVTCTVDDLIKAYGRQGEIRRFCHECADWKTCRGVKWSTCPYRKYYIKNEVKTNKQTKVVRYKRLTKEQKETIITMYRKGERACNIARATGISSQNVQNIIRKSAYYKPKKLIDWSIYDQQILNLIRRGVTFKKIIEELGLTQYQVYERARRLKHLGLIENKDYRSGERMARKNGR